MYNICMKNQLEKKFHIKVALSVVVTVILVLAIKFGVDYFTLKYYEKKNEKNKIEYMKMLAYHHYTKNQVKFYKDIINISDYIQKNKFYHDEVNSYDLALTIVQESFRKKLDPYLILAIIEVESDFEHSSESVKGAKGLMQIKPETARYVLVMEDIKASSKNLKKDVLLNVRLGIVYYSYLLKKFDGNHKYALIAYNLGVNKVFSLMSQKVNLPKSYYHKVYSKYKSIAKLYNQNMMQM